MRERNLDLIELAARVSDGARVDWDRAEQSAADETERGILRHLRLVESVAEVHRSQQISPSAKDPLEMSADVAVTLSGDSTIIDPDSGAEPIESWGGLEIRARIGAGAFGEVFRAWDANLDRQVALKLLKREPSARESLASSVIKEGRLLARVRHPNVVTIHGAETHEGRVGLWMELVEGRSLAEWLDEQGKLGAREASLIGLDLCRALTAVHAAGLVHRDIKARNVMREEGGRILLMDFGAGRDLRDIESGDDRTISGTPLYIAPEVYGGNPATARSDIYSLGVLMYHLVTGRYPVEAPTLDELKQLHSRGNVRLLRDERSDLPEAFVKLIERALERDPEKRFTTAGEMEKSLSAALGVAGDAPSAPAAGRSGSRLPAWSVAAIVTLVVVALAVIWLVPTPIGDLEQHPIEAQATETVADAAGPPAPATDTAGPPAAATAVSGVKQATAETVAPRAAVETYTVEAALYRVGKSGRDQLEDGARLSLGDTLSVEFEASRDLYVYIFSEDEQGSAFALFPMPRLDLDNPLPANQRHLLPGSAAGKSKLWGVTTRGGRERIVVLASPERQVEYEAELAKLPRPREDEMAIPISESTLLSLRGIGGLTRAPEQAPAGTVDRLFDLANKLTGRPEKVEGNWKAVIVLENPIE